MKHFRKQWQIRCSDGSEVHVYGLLGREWIHIGWNKFK